MLKVQFGGPFKELDIFFVGKRIAAFDIVDTNFIEPLRDLQRSFRKAQAAERREWEADLQKPERWHNPGYFAIPRAI